MERKKASDFHPEVLKLFDGYVHGALSRRDFLDRAAKFAVGTFTAAAMLESLRPNFAWAQQVPKDDARIRTEYRRTRRRRGPARCEAISRGRRKPPASSLRSSSYTRTAG